MRLGWRQAKRGERALPGPEPPVPRGGSGNRRVLMVFEPLEGGVPAHVLELAARLRRYGWEAEVAGPAGSPWLSRLSDAGLSVYELPFARPPGTGVLRAARALRTLDRSRGYTIVHAQSSMAGAVVRLALPDRGRLVYTPHCFSFLARFGAIPRQVYRAVEQALLPRTAAVIAASAWERDQAIRFLRGAGARTRVVRNGVSVASGARLDPDLVAFKGAGRLAGFIGRLVEQKNPLALVRAAASLHRRGALQGRVALVGNGELRAEVDEEIEHLGVGDAVRVFPYQGSVEPYLRAFDLMVVPSLWDSMPISVLEAMACGLPVVASRVGGVSEAVLDGVNGRLVEPGDPEELAGILAELLADPDRLIELGRAGRRIAEERFSVDRMVRQTAELYEELVER